MWEPLHTCDEAWDNDFTVRPHRTTPTILLVQCRHGGLLPVLEWCRLPKHASTRRNTIPAHNHGFDSIIMHSTVPTEYSHDANTTMSFLVLRSQTYRSILWWERFNGLHVVTMDIGSTWCNVTTTTCCNLSHLGQPCDIGMREYCLQMNLGAAWIFRSSREKIVEE